jgi:hypothetical protein
MEILPEQRPHERRLAGAGSADKKDVLSGLDR